MYVLSAFKWGFNFWMNGPIWDRQVHPKYYVKNVVWSPDSPVTMVQQTDASGNPVFGAGGAPVMLQLGGLSGGEKYDFHFGQSDNGSPSAEMSKVLDAYFP